MVETRRPTSTDPRIGAAQAPRSGSVDPELAGGAEDHRRRPWLPLLVALVLAVLVVWGAGQTAAKLWLQDLDQRLNAAGAGANAYANALERDQLAAYRAIAFTEGFAPSLARYDAKDIEARLAPVDANQGMPMVDIIDDQGRVVFAFRSQGSVRPIYRQRLDVAIVRQALAGEVDQYGERFSDLLTTDEGPLLATAGPVRLDGKVVGAVLVMTPLDQLLSRSTNYHGALLTAYSLDRGDPMATTTGVRTRSLGTDLRVRLAQSGQLPYGRAFTIGGKPAREEIAALAYRHKAVSFIGVALPDRSHHVAQRVMLIVGLGLVVLTLIISSVAYAIFKDRLGLGAARRAKEPLAIPAVTGDDGSHRSTGSGP